MSDISSDVGKSPATVAVAAVPAQTSGLMKFLRKARGQIDPPVDVKSPYSNDATVSTYEDISAAPSAAVFVDGAKFKEPIAEYEGRHRWNPLAEWDEKEEKRLVRKLDVRICAYVCFMFFALQLDRGNISQALSDNMLTDLGMNTNDYNYGQMIFYCSFLAAELPSQLISKKIGPDNWIPIQMISWSIIACCQSRLTGRATFFITRALLGVFEGGFIPDVVLYLSYFYTSKELPIRLSFFWGAYMSTFIIGSFLAFGILHMGGINGWAGWRWLFALEGILTALIGLLSWFYLPPSPTESASWFRGKNGWFSEREEVIMVNRILRDDPSKGDMHNRQGISYQLFREAISDYDMWPIYFLGITWGLPQISVQAYLTLTLKALGWDTFEVNLLSIPAYTIFLLQLILWTWVSEKINNRFLIVLFCQIYMLPLFIALEVLPADASQWARYVVSILIVGYPYIHAILVALTSRNAGSVRTRTVGTAIYNMAVQLSNILATFVYRDDDKPLYRRGNKVCLALIAFNMCWIIFCKSYYMYKNRKRASTWGAMSQEERDQYLATTTDEGNKRLDFRFSH